MAEITKVKPCSVLLDQREGLRFSAYCPVSPVKRQQEKNPCSSKRRKFSPNPPLHPNIDLEVESSSSSDVTSLDEPVISTQNDDHQYNLEDSQSDSDIVSVDSGKNDNQESTVHYYCQICCIFFQDVTSCALHMKSKHEIVVVRCVKCNANYDEIESDHQPNDDSEILQNICLKCKLSAKKIDLLTNFKKKYKVQSGLKVKYICCPNCHMIFTNQSSMDRHYKKTHAVKPLLIVSKDLTKDVSHICPKRKCTYETKIESDLFLHFEATHGGNEGTRNYDKSIIHNYHSEHFNNKLHIKEETDLNSSSSVETLSSKIEPFETVFIKSENLELMNEDVKSPVPQSEVKVEPFDEDSLVDLEESFTGEKQNLNPNQISNSFSNEASTSSTDKTTSISKLSNETISKFSIGFLYECKFCKGFYNKSSLTSHKCKYHQVIEQSVSAESNKFECKYAYIKNSSSKPEFYKCNYCTKICDSRKSLSNHFYVKHRDCNKHNIKTALLSTNQTISESSIVKNVQTISSRQATSSLVPISNDEPNKGLSNKFNIQQSKEKTNLFHCNICEASLNNEKSWNLHKSTHAKFNARYSVDLPCLHCLKLFKYVQQLIEHTSAVHFFCKTCNRYFTTEEKLAEHKMHHALGRIKYYQCLNCRKQVFKTWNEFSKHSYESHLYIPVSFKSLPLNIVKTISHPNYIKCPYCETFLNTSTCNELYYCHLKKVHNLVKCRGACKSVFISGNNDENCCKTCTTMLERTSIHKINEKKIMNQEDHKSLNSFTIKIESLEDTEISNTYFDPETIDVEDFKTCDICNNKFLNSVDLNFHKEIHSMTTNLYDKQFCDEARYIEKTGFNNFCSLQIHKYKHNSRAVLTSQEFNICGKQCYRCPICYAVFTETILFYSHCHPYFYFQPNLFNCNVCNINFDDLKALHEHNKRIHNIVLEECKICNLFLSTQLVVRKHVCEHFKDLIYCESCGIDIPDNCFKIHFKTCSGKKVKLCAFCDQEINNKECYLTHLDSHSNQGSFNNLCELCYNLFPSRSNLLSHKSRTVKCSKIYLQR